MEMTGFAGSTHPVLSSSLGGDEVDIGGLQMRINC
jgi:hypothetical protein